MTKRIINNGGQKEAFVNESLVTVYPGINEVSDEVASLFLESYEDVVMEEVEDGDAGVCGEPEEVSEGLRLPEPTTRVRTGKQRPTA